jgi:D-beta-D-heptose 7-phosphate kinase/D-beta-D-heptose 1-phosphate adenosyltransferase
MNILVIGDSCQDVFIYGKCDRLCPEAPVPIIIPNKIKKVGGMALNVYENVKSLGVNVDIITNKKKITKTRYIDETSNQIILRVDSEKNGYDRITKIESINFDNYDAVIISDYNKGFLLYDDIKFICNSHNYVFIDTKKIIDNNFINCKFIKINEHEYKNNINNNNFLNTINNKLIITLGNKGATHNKKNYPVEKVEIKDMVGAGDTFISALTYKFILTNNIVESIRFANECSTIIVQHKGVNKIGDFIKINK